jgi:hypothetical protein
MELLRNIDLLVLLLALPVFVALDAPLTGYFAAGGAWVVARFLKHLAERRRDRAFAAHDRNTALGVTAASMLGRLWILAAAILIVGLVDEREAGLAAALLAAALVTASLIAETVAHMGSGGEA